MKWLVFGSLNLDKTFSVDHIVAPGETLAVQEMNVFAGGKGFNQAVALARAGNQVSFAGAVGEDGDMLLDAMRKEGIDSRRVLRLPGVTGQTVIQVDRQGQNCILLLAGANGQISREHVEQALQSCERGDWLLLQNEISNLPFIVERAHEIGMKIALNPSPYRDSLVSLLPQVDFLLLNEVEGHQVTGETEPGRILDQLEKQYPNAQIVLTLGADGAWFMAPGRERVYAPAQRCQVVDTTAAGDTFTGFFLTAYLSQGSAAAALRLAAIASSIAVSRPGAVPSIPNRQEVLAQAEALS